MILRSISTKEKFPRTENFPKMPLLKVESKYFSDGKFVSANHILQNFVSAENLNEPYSRARSVPKNVDQFIS